jgi:altronate dehydratase small subunit
MDMGAGTEIVKFGEVIGKTSAAVKKGEYVHVHNLDSMRARGDLK